MSRSLSALLLSGLSICLLAAPLKAQVYEKTPELRGDIVVLPLTLINNYPFISGAVNGVDGKFMFDTGFGAAISLNDNLISLPHKKNKRDGVTGSGQVFRNSINDTVCEVRFANGPTYRNLENVSSGNFDFLQKYVTPDFLGFIGQKFVKGYLIKFDYLDRKITLYKGSPERDLSKDFLANEKVLAVIGFEIRKLDNHPIVKLKINGIDVLGGFDSGQNGLLQLDAPSEKILRSKRVVIPTDTDSNGDTLLTVRNIVLDGKFRTDLKGLESATLDGTKVIRREGNITEPNLMTFGYRFMSQYKTVWDYAQKKIYILEY